MTTCWQFSILGTRTQPTHCTWRHEPGYRVLQRSKSGVWSLEPLSPPFSLCIASCAFLLPLLATLQAASRTAMQNDLLLEASLISSFQHASFEADAPARPTEPVPRISTTYATSSEEGCKSDAQRVGVQQISPYRLEEPVTTTTLCGSILGHPSHTRRALSAFTSPKGERWSGSRR